MRTDDWSICFGVMVQVGEITPFLEMYWPLMQHTKKKQIHVSIDCISGVNHHNQSIVFASAVVGNETEQTYI